MIASDDVMVRLGDGTWPLSLSVAALRRIGIAIGIKGVNPGKIIGALDPEDFGSVALFVHAMIPPSAEPPSLAEVEELITTRTIREVMSAVQRAISGDDPEPEEDSPAGPPVAPSP